MIINEMAMDRSDFIRLRNGLKDPFMEHIFLVASNPNGKDTNHHVTELVTWCMKLDKITLKSGGRPNADEFLGKNLLTKVDTINDADNFLGLTTHDGHAIDVPRKRVEKFYKVWSTLRIELADAFSSKLTHTRKYYEELINKLR